MSGPEARRSDLADAMTALLFGLSRPHDGSQLDEDMEGLLLDAAAAVARIRESL